MANAEWWEAKLADNIERDRDTERRAAQAGWALIMRKLAEGGAVDASSSTLRIDRIDEKLDDFLLSTNEAP